MRKKLSSKIIISVSIIVLLLEVILITLGFSLSNSQALKSGKLYYESSVKETKLLIEDDFNEVYNFTRDIVNSIDSIRQSDFIDEKRIVLENIIVEVLKEYPNIIGVNLGFEPNAFDGRDRYYIGDPKYGDDGRFMPYISLDQNANAHIVPIENIDTSDFYTIAKNTNTEYISEPYEYNVQGESILLSTIVIPVTEGGKFLGIVGLDIPVSKVQTILEDHFIGDESIQMTIATTDGMIVADNLEENLICENIKVIHDDFEEDLSIIKRHGFYTKSEDNNTFELLTTIEIGDHINDWYILSTVDSSFLRTDTVNNTVVLIVVGVIAAILTIVLLRIAINRTIKPLVEFTDRIDQFDIDELDSYQIENNADIEEVTLLTNAYKKVIEILKEEFTKRDEEEYKQKSYLHVSELLQSSTDLASFAENIMSFVCGKIGAVVGIMYVLDNSEAETVYVQRGGYSYTFQDGHKDRYMISEGLVGQAAKDREILSISEIPTGYMSISLGLAQANPRTIVLVPCVFNDVVVAVLEMGFIKDITEEDNDFLENIRSNIGISTNSILSGENIKILLNKAQIQAEQLESKQIELKESNVELKKQTENLQDSQAELQSQQEELRVINEELENNSNQLVIRKEELEKKNNDLKIAQKEVEKKAKDLEIAGKYKSEFLANMSHELRTPLNSILILSELLSENDSGTLTKDEIEFAETINTSGKDLLELINDILDLSKIESGKIEICIEAIILKEFRLNMLRQFGSLAKNKNIGFNINLMEGTPEVIMGDIQKTNQVVKNLLSNAFKFTSEGDIEVRISVDGENVIYQVVDSGIGIDENKLNSIFEAFKQEDGTTSRKYGGTGLGLSISREYARLLKGKLTVKSEKNVGSTFTLELPTHYENVSLQKVIEAEDMNPYFAKTQASKIKVEDAQYVLDDRNNIDSEDEVFLIIDDDIRFTQTILDLIHSKGYKSLAAETGENGLYLADLYHPSAILLDIGLPGIDGWEVLDHLQANTNTDDIPVYIISGREKEEKSLVHGAVDFYQKPISKSQIEEMIEETKLINKKEFKSILVVEDNEIQRNSVVKLLTRNYSDLEITSCSSEKEALELMNTEEFNLLILDLELGDYNAFELIEDLKNDDKHKRVPIIVYTGRDVSREEERELRSKVNEIIIKGDQSLQRLLSEIKLFIHKVENSNDPAVLKKDIEKEVYLNKKILVVDDDMRNVFAVTSILESNGMIYEVANDGLEALEKIESVADIDLVLMDIMMPNMDGYEAMKEIREIPKHKNLPIIALTAKAMKGDRDKCIKHGANEYLSKPINKAKLLSLLRVWLT